MRSKFDHTSSKTQYCSSGKNKDGKNYSKVFVGNVPYHCADEEFRNCFKDLNGFITADIKRKYNSQITRGFGFVVFDTQPSASKLINDGDVTLKGRRLRFSHYGVQSSYKNENNKIYLDHISENISFNDLVNELSKNGELVSCAIKYTGDKIFGEATYKDETGYNSAISKQIYINGCDVKVTPYRRYKRTKFVQPNINSVYREGYRVGHITGYSEGFKQGLEHTEGDEHHSIFEIIN